MKIRTGPEPLPGMPPRPSAPALVIPTPPPPRAPAPIPPAFRPAHANELRCLAEVAYAPMRDVAAILTIHGFRHSQPLSQWLTGTQGFVALKDRRVVIAFRGSESTLDWIVDCAALPWGRPPRHLGFSCAWWSVRAKVHAYLEVERGEFDTVELCGHSLGGAIAKLAAFELAPKYPIAAVVTLGAPRAFWGRGVRKYDEAMTGGAALGDLTLSYVNGADIVATMPPAILGYCHTKGLHPSVTEHDGGWLSGLLSRIKQRRESTPGLATWTPPAALGLKKVTRAPENKLLDSLANAYCFVETHGPFPKALVVNLLAPIGLFVAYLWILWMVGGASASHKLALYRKEFSREGLTAGPWVLPPPSVAVRIGGLISTLPLFALGLWGAWKLLVFSEVFVEWGWHTTVAIVRQLN